MALDVDERHLLRMGHGEEELETEKDYSRSTSHVHVILDVHVTLAPCYTRPMSQFPHVA